MINRMPQTLVIVAIAMLGSGGVVQGQLDAGVSPPAAARMVAVPDSSTVLSVWEGPDASGVVRPHYAVSLDGVTFSAGRPTSYAVELQDGGFDPLAADMPAVPETLAAGPDTHLHIVQFVVPPLPEFRQTLRALGAIDRWYLPRHSLVVAMPDAVRDAVAALPYVRWIGPYHPAYRIEPFVRDQLAADRDGADAAVPLETLVYNVMLFEHDRLHKAAVAGAIEAIGGDVRRVDAGKHLMEVALTPAQLEQVLRFDSVAYVDRWGPMEADMDIVRAVSGANYVESVAGYDGTGVRGEVIDIGFNLAHVDFDSNPLIQHSAVGSDSHGAATSGIIFGDGNADPAARGFLPAGQGLVADSSFMEGTSRYDLAGELVNELDVVFQSASIGSPRTTQYTTISADMDALLFDWDLVICQSQSNAGNQDSRPQAWAKNIISVGGIRHQNTADPADDNWGAGASIGPAADGRVKPDIAHFYDSTYTVTTGSSTSYTCCFGGTSGATPIVAGHVGLFFEMWNDGIFNNAADPLASVFDNRCHMTTAKAMMINTALQYDWRNGGPNEDIDRFKQGWGIPNLQRLYDLRSKMLIVDETDVLTNFGSKLYTVAVDPGEPELRATMTYADLPGLPAAGVHRINDLDLRVTSPSGVIYWGNNGLITGLESLPGGNANQLDTVENVRVVDPEPGFWSVEVIAAELIEDARPETFGTLDTDYALVVSGVQEMLPPLTVRLPSGSPMLVPVGEATVVEVEILPGTESIVPGTELLHYRFDPAAPFTEAGLVDLGGGTYEAIVPGAGCDDTPQFFVSADGDGGTTVTSPPAAPAAAFQYDVGAIESALDDDFESDSGWTVENVDLADGGWDRGVPAGGGDRGDPAADFDGSGQCYLTDNVDGNSDIDGGPTRLVSPRIDVSGLPDAEITYARWFTNDDSDEDRLDVEVSSDNGTTWVIVESVPAFGGWEEASFRVADFVLPSDEVRVRFSATDNPNDSVSEAGIDAVRVTSFVCEESTVSGDFDGDLDVDFADLLALLAAWGDCPEPPATCPTDLDGNGQTDFGDLLTVLTNWG